MKKYRFNPTQRYAVWKYYQQKCLWCHEPIGLEATTIDHLIPESLRDSPPKLQEILSKFGLSPTFDLNDYPNWMPLHAHCNARKNDKVFSGAPVILELLEQLSTNAAEVRKIAQDVKASRRKDTFLGQIAIALENSQISREELEALFAQADVEHDEDYYLLQKGVRITFDHRWRKTTGRVFDVFGFLALSVTLVTWISFQRYMGNDPGPTYLLIGLPIISLLEILLLYVAWGYASRTPSTRRSHRLIPGFGAPMRGNWVYLRWLVWALYIALPLYICGHFIHMQKHLTLIRLPTPEFGFHRVAEINFPNFFRWSSLDLRLLLDGQPHYRWTNDHGVQAFPFFQPWIQTLLGVFAILYGIVHTIRCFTGWGLPQRAKAILDATGPAETSR